MAAGRYWLQDGRAQNVRDVGHPHRCADWLRLLLGNHDSLRRPVGLAGRPGSPLLASACYRVPRVMATFKLNARADDGRLFSPIKNRIGSET